MTDKDIANNLVAVLERIVDEEQVRYDRSYRAAADTNNMDGVGIHFDYAPYPTLPKWFDEAKTLIARAKESEQCPQTISNAQSATVEPSSTKIRTEALFVSGISQTRRLIATPAFARLSR
jgi:hypothetical protein